MKNQTTTAFSLFQRFPQGRWTSFALGLFLLMVLSSASAKSLLPYDDSCESIECLSDSQCGPKQECVSIAGSFVCDEAAESCTLVADDDGCFITECVPKEKPPCLSQGVECIQDDDCALGEECSFNGNGNCLSSQCIPKADSFCPGLYIECFTDEECGPQAQCEMVTQTDDCMIQICLDTPIPECPDFLQECSDDSDCGANESCAFDFDSPCPASTCQGKEIMCPAIAIAPECFENKDCETTSFCLIDEDCGFNVCKPLFPVECTNDVECGECMGCNDAGQCIAPLKVECINDFYCGPGLECSTCGQCVPEGTPECLSDAECGECMACNNAGQCAAPQEVECTNDFYCGPGLECSTCGQCVPEGTPECSSDAECGECMACNDAGQCAAPQEVECTNDFYCGTGLECSTCGQCVPQGEPECVTDSDCECYASCSDGSCVGPEYIPCSEDSCGAGMKCDECGACVSDGPIIITPECSQHADCSCTEVCSNGFCMENDSTECESNEDCPENWICGECRTCEEPTIIIVVPQCTQDSDCPCSNSCIDGLCSPWESATCSDDSCGQGMECDLCGICIATEPLPPLCADEGACETEDCPQSCPDETCLDGDCDDDDTWEPIEDINLQGYATGSGTIGGCSTSRGGNPFAFSLLFLAGALLVLRSRQKGFEG